MWDFANYAGLSLGFIFQETFEEGRSHKLISKWWLKPLYTVIKKIKTDVSTWSRVQHSTSYEGTL